MAGKVNVTFTLNGERKTFETYPMTRLLDILREQASLSGTKEGCGEGECGACSLFLDGALVNSCLLPVAQAQGATVETIESVATEQQWSEVQEAFLKFGGAQCGICTPGMVMASVNILRKNPKPSEQEVREGLAGNLCRCTGYVKIVESVMKAFQKEA